MPITAEQEQKIAQYALEKKIKRIYGEDALKRLQAAGEAKRKPKGAMQELMGTDELPQAFKTGFLGAARKLSKGIGLPDILGKEGVRASVKNPLDKSFAESKQKFEALDPSRANRIVEGLAEDAPAFALPMEGVALKGLPFTKKLMQLTKQTAPSGAMTGALASDNDSPMGAAVGAVINPAVMGAGEIIKSFPAFARYLAGSNATPEQIKKFLSKLAPNEPVIGAEALDSQRLRDIESGYLMGSSPTQVKKANQVFNNIGSQGEKIADSFGANAPIADREKELMDMLDSAFDEAQAKKSDLYDERNKLSAKHNFDMKFNNTRKAAQELVNDIQATQEVFGTIPDNAFAKEVQSLANVKDVPNVLKDKNGKLKNVPTIMQSKAKMLDGLAKAEGDEYKKKAYYRLANSIRQDLKETFENTGIKSLQAAQKKADDYFKNRFALYRDKEIAPYINDKKDFRRILGNIINGNMYQYPERLEKFIQAATKEGESTEPARNLVLQHYFKDALERNEDGKLFVNAPKMVSKYRRLTPEIRDQVFTKEQREMLDKLDKDWAKAEKTFGKYKLNPATGYNIVPTDAMLNRLKQALTIGKYVVPAATGIGGFAEGGTGSAEGALSGGALAAVLAFSSPTVLAKILSSRKALSALTASDKEIEKAVQPGAESLSKLLIGFMGS